MGHGVPSSTPRAAAIGDCGAIPLQFDCIKKLIKYWLKLIREDETSLTKAAYDMLYALDLAGRRTWAGEVKDVLYNLGFGDVWTEQQVGNEEVFLNILEDRLLYKLQIEWRDEMEENNRLATYRTFKMFLTPEPYLYEIHDFGARKCLALIRCSIHPLNI
jgi:hypothetical protein